LENQNKEETSRKTETTKVVVEINQLKNGRVRTELTMNKDFTTLEAVSRTCKKRIGCGGTVKNGKILLQGDQTKRINPQLFELHGINPEIELIRIQEVNI
jgi:translation initiation factor 1 (eIF-1/SUI1)